MRQNIPFCQMHNNTSYSKLIEIKLFRHFNPLQWRVWCIGQSHNWLFIVCRLLHVERNGRTVFRPINWTRINYVKSSSNNAVILLFLFFLGMDVTICLCKNVCQATSIYHIRAVNMHCALGKYRIWLTSKSLTSKSLCLQISSWDKQQCK